LKKSQEQENVMAASVEKRIVERLEGFAEALENREQEPIKNRFDCRRIVLTLKPKPYAPEMVKKAREMLGASQAVFALFLGVSVKTVQAWEQGLFSPKKMACRFMDEIQKDPALYQRRLREAAVAK
jgi:putative transcriptional regulator